MRRMFSFLTCTVLLLGSLVLASAQSSISLTVDTKNPMNLVNAEIKDAPLKPY